MNTMLSTTPNKKSSSFVFPVEVDTERKIAQNKSSFYHTVTSSGLSAAIKDAKYEMPNYSGEKQYRTMRSNEESKMNAFSPKSSYQRADNTSVTRSQGSSVMIKPRAISKINSNISKLCEQLNIYDDSVEDN